MIYGKEKCWGYLQKLRWRCEVWDLVVLLVCWLLGLGGIWWFPVVLRPWVYEVIFLVVWSVSSYVAACEENLDETALSLMGEELKDASYWDSPTAGIEAVRLRPTFNQFMTNFKSKGKVFGFILAFWLVMGLAALILL